MSVDQAPPEALAAHPRCTICRHHDRARIELAMARGMGKRETAKRFSVSPDAVFRHWNAHTPDSVKAVRKAEVLKPGARLSALVEEGSEGVLEKLLIVQAVLFTQLDFANELNDGRTVAALSGRLIDLQQTVAKLTGELRPHAGTTVNNLILTPDYLDLRLRLVQALRPYPDAAQAVAAVFRQTENTNLMRLAPPAETPESAHDGPGV